MIDKNQDIDKLAEGHPFCIWKRTVQEPKSILTLWKMTPCRTHRSLQNQ